MSGHSVFDSLVDGAIAAHKQREANPKISQEEFNDWREYYIWDALHGVRYGQSFCNRFNITDHVLFYVISESKEADIYIEKHYIDRP